MQGQQKYENISCWWFLYCCWKEGHTVGTGHLTRKRRFKTETTGLCARYINHTCSSFPKAPFTLLQYNEACSVYQNVKQTLSFNRGNNNNNNINNLYCLSRLTHKQNGGSVARWLGRLLRDPEIPGSRPALTTR